MIRRVSALFVACVLISVISACRGVGTSAAEASSSSSGADLAPLDRAAIGALAREACPRVLTRTFPLDNTAGDVTTGKLWVRRCTARALPKLLEIDVDVLGWQWIGEGSWGFDVREYVYFRASVHANLHASVESTNGQPKVRVWSDAPPDVTVREIGRVSARAEGPASSLLGVASGIFGQGPNALATAALRSHVRDHIRERATRGLVIALGDTPAPGTRDRDRASTELLRETEELFPGGALISGSFPPDVATTLHFDVATNGAALARAVCVVDALAFVDAVVAGQPHPAAEEPSGVLPLVGRGETQIAAQPCAWVLVTGARNEASAVVSLVLEPAKHVRHPTTRRWVRATLLAYDFVDAGDGGQHLFAFTTGPLGGATRSLGRPLTSARSPSVWLVAEPVELDDGNPLVVEVRTLKPRSRSFWSATTTYDEAPLGRATVVASENGASHEQRRVMLERDGRSVGWVDIALEVVDE